MSGGVYAYRVRKPGLLGKLRVPLVSTRWGYVGETTSFPHRDKQHRETQPWAPLIVSVHRWHLPAWKPLLHLAETLAILVLWPAYNIEKNRWNPRRIKPWDARRGREGWLTVKSLLLIIAALGVAYVYGKWFR